MSSCRLFCCLKHADVTKAALFCKAGGYSAKPVLLIGRSYEKACIVSDCDMYEGDTVTLNFNAANKVLNSIDEIEGKIIIKKVRGILYEYYIRVNGIYFTGEMQNLQL